MESHDDKRPIDKKLDDDLAVAPPKPDEGTTHIRPAHDAEDNAALAADPSDPGAKLDIALDESFPSSDAPSNTRPGTNEPAPSSGFDEEAERKAAGKRD